MNMNITNSLIKYVASLSRKKVREDEGCFVAEGTKCVKDTWDYFNCRMIIATKAWYEQNGHSGHLNKIIFANSQQMQRMSQLSTASDVIAVYDIPVREVSDKDIRSNLNVVLENIQDPGNLGTIIRLCDWFGIKNIFCSPNTVDVYNHKVIQATMGAISRVCVKYCDLEELLEQYADIPIYGTSLQGKNIYKVDLSPVGFVIFGNEGRGMSQALANLSKVKLRIPSYPVNVTTSESLNVGIAAAITIGEFRRRAIMEVKGSGDGK